jgi:CIC family chloride channel protein
MVASVPTPPPSNPPAETTRVVGAALEAAERRSEGRRRRLFHWERQTPTVGRGHLFMVVVAIICGLGSGLGAVALRALILLVQDVFFGGGTHALALLEHTTWSWRLVAPALGGLVVGPLVHFLAREAKGHGVPEVMESIILRGGAIRPRVVVVKAVASAISIGSGGSVGREGPIVQIGAALGSTIGQLLGVTANQLRTLVGCGAAAGIAAAFNAPIAGALFAVEILLGDFGVPQFSPIVISSVVATVVSRHFLGNFPAFVVPPYELVSPFELFLYVLVGVAAGLVALAFITVLYRSEEFFERLRMPEYLKAALGGLAVGAIGIWLPYVFGVGYDTINAALTGQIPLALLGVLIAGKMIATSITLASGGSGGVFAPSLFLGAMTGGAFGIVIHRWLPTWTAASGAYALVTMGAVVGAATHAPITAIIIIFELTGDYRIIAPLMVACVISTLIATQLRRDSIYTLKLRLRGLEPFKEEEPNILLTLHVRDVIDRSPEVIRASAPLEHVLDLAVNSDHGEFFVTDTDGALVGVVRLSTLRRLLFELDTLRPILVAADLTDTALPRVTEDENLDVVMRLFSDADVEELPVTDPHDPRKLIGSIHRQAVINARNKEMLRRDLAGTFSSTVSLVGKGRKVDVGDGYVVEEVRAPRTFLGRALRELDLPGRYGIHVIFIRSGLGPDGAHLRVASADDRVQEGDSLIVAGPKQSTARLERL